MSRLICSRFIVLVLYYFARDAVILLFINMTLINASLIWLFTRKEAFVTFMTFYAFQVISKMRDKR